MLTTMESTEHHTWATEALRTFWRRTFTVLANQLQQGSLQKQRDSMEMRAMLERLK